MHHNASLTRACLASLIPSGESVLLPEGASVVVHQTLGGHITVIAPDGRLARIDQRDADALGEGFVCPSAPTDAGVTPPGEFSLEQVWQKLRTVYDPEIPVNIVELGLIYDCSSVPLPEGGQRVSIRMTMTAPGCGMGGILSEDVRVRCLEVPGVREAEVELVWDPPWDASLMSDVARLELGWM